MMSFLHTTGYSTREATSHLDGVRVFVPLGVSYEVFEPYGLINIVIYRPDNVSFYMKR
jgi:hypothetical protein